MKQTENAVISFVVCGAYFQGNKIEIPFVICYSGGIVFLLLTYLKRVKLFMYSLRWIFHGENYLETKWKRG
ncbi:MAG: hypothetical protein ABII82_03320 [Verrucomicrobiota bacterium]